MMTTQFVYDSKRPHRTKKSDENTRPATSMQDYTHRTMAKTSGKKIATAENYEIDKPTISEYVARAVAIVGL